MAELYDYCEWNECSEIIYEIDLLAEKYLEERREHTAKISLEIEILECRSGKDFGELFIFWSNSQPSVINSIKEMVNKQFPQFKENLKTLLLMM